MVLWRSSSYQKVSFDRCQIRKIRVDTLDKILSSRHTENLVHGDCIVNSTEILFCFIYFPKNSNIICFMNIFLFCFQYFRQTTLLLLLLAKIQIVPHLLSICIPPICACVQLGRSIQECEFGTEMGSPHVRMMHNWARALYTRKLG